VEDFIKVGTKVTNGEITGILVGRMISTKEVCIDTDEARATKNLRKNTGKLPGVVWVPEAGIRIV
jgi:hypothetical protein